EKFTVLANGSGSCRIGVVSDSGAVRSTTSTVPSANAATSWVSSDIVPPNGRARDGLVGAQTRTYRRSAVPGRHQRSTRSDRAATGGVRPGPGGVGAQGRRHAERGRRVTTGADQQRINGGSTAVPEWIQPE